MNIFACRKRLRITPARNHKRIGKASDLDTRCSQAFPDSPAELQRKPACACGGGCPRCQGVGGLIQTKLRIGQPNDKYEQEADRVADQVMRMPEPKVQHQSEEKNEYELIQTKPLISHITPLVQRQEDPEGEEEETLQTQAIPSQTPKVTPDVESYLRVNKGSGQPLSDSVRGFAEPRFGQDFSQVRIHTDAQAAESARFIGAEAYTIGCDVVFSAGRYDPATDAGKHLLTHELAHVIQQPQIDSSRPFVQRQAGVPQQNPALLEWQAHPGIHHHFHNGFQTYLQLRPLYQARGIQDPAQYLDNNIVQVRFLGHRTPAHSDMRAPLQTAEDELNANPLVIQSFWAFVPRTTSGGALSNHALGRAVDIDPGQNPFVRNSHDIRVIRAITGADLGQPISDVDLHLASEIFQSTFDQLWVNQRMYELEQLSNQPHSDPESHAQILYLTELLQSIETRRDALDRYAERGFLNVEQSLIEALMGAGFSWGGQWQHGRDFMHFELPNP